jgi:hypothetical protein
MAVLRTLRHLEMHAVLRGDSATERQRAYLAPQLESHGGPIRAMSLPTPVTRISALSTGALAASRKALAGTKGTLMWTDVEDTLTPEFHKGAISFSGEELPPLAALRREAALVRYWLPVLPGMRDERAVKAGAVPLPPGVIAQQVLSSDANGPSAVSVTNGGSSPFTGELRVFYPPAKRPIVLPAVQIPAGESLWLPVNIPLANGPLCKNCAALGNEDSLVYATAELSSVEFENGILALEFSAPVAAEAVLHLSKEPSGPFLAAGRPTAFDWDAGNGHARLKIPAGKGPAHRVRVGLALDPPDSSAFFGDTKVLIIGHTNRISTNYSSELVKQRSRLRAPAACKVVAVPQGPLELGYDVTVPPDMLHGEHVEMSLEADGVQMGHTRLQLLRPVSLRVREAVSRHFGTRGELPVSPALIPVDQRQGRSISITIRNNFPEIRTYRLAVEGEGIDFTPAQTEISIGGASERDVSLRVFVDKASPGLHRANVKVTGPAQAELPMQILVLPRGKAVSYTSEAGYVLETQRARAVFSNPRFTRLLEFVWKDSERNVIPEAGLPGGQAAELRDAELTITGPSPLPSEAPKSGKYSDVVLTVARPAPDRAVYTLSR